MTISEEIIKLGLSPKETQFYLAALELGQFSLVEIAKKTSLKRPTCYLLADELAKRGLLSVLPKAKKTLYAVEPPENLVSQIEKQLHLAQGLLPQLKAITAKEKSTPQIKFFFGEIGVESIYNDMLKESPEKICGILSPEDLFTVTGRKFLENWIDRRKEKGIKVLSLQTKSQKSKEKFFYGDSTEELREVKYLPTEVSFSSSINIYHNKVAFISSKKDNFSFIIQSKEFNSMMQELFTVLWGISSKR